MRVYLFRHLGVTRSSIRGHDAITESNDQPMSAQAKDLVLYEKQGAVAYISINRPSARNALTYEMYERIETFFAEADHDDTVQVMVLRGNGGHFAAGTDIAQFRDFSRPEQAVAYEQQQDRTMTNVESITKPTIAAIEGIAAGGGALMAVSCDLRIMAMSAKIGVPVSRTLGNCLSIQNCQRIVDLVGPSRTKEIIYSAKLFSAAEAVAIGLANEVVEDADFAARVSALAEDIATHAPLTMRTTKEQVRRIARKHRIAQDASNDLVEQCYMSADFKEGVEAFLGKRAPAWTGR